MYVPQNNIKVVFSDATEEQLRYTFPQETKQNPVWYNKHRSKQHKSLFEKRVRSASKSNINNRSEERRVGKEC